MQPEGFRQLLSQAQAGDRQAMDRLFELIRPHLALVASAYADSDRPDESTSDLIQDAALRAWQAIGEFRGAEGDDETHAMFMAWLTRIVHRVGLNAARDRQAQRRNPPQKTLSLDVAGRSEESNGPAMEPAANGPSPSGNLAGVEQRQIIQAALEQVLDDEDRTIVRLRFFDGLSLRQISERLNVTYDHVRERYRVSMRKLERELGPTMQSDGG
jgi:RNA polymerase sigma factor (sigma-70 family)